MHAKMEEAEEKEKIPKKFRNDGNVLINAISDIHWANGLGEKK